MKRTIKSMYIPLGKAMYGGGTIIHRETELLPNVAYAQGETIKHYYSFRPARIKTRKTHWVARYEWDGKRWNETSYLACKNKSEANKLYKTSTAK